MNTQLMNVMRRNEDAIRYKAGIQKIIWTLWPQQDSF